MVAATQIPPTEVFVLAPPAKDPCVYFLMSGDRVVYVGHSGNLRTRIVEHSSRYRGEFDSVRFFRTASIDEALSEEARLIIELRPALNLRGKEFCR